MSADTLCHTCSTWHIDDRSILHMRVGIVCAPIQETSYFTLHSFDDVINTVMHNIAQCLCPDVRVQDILLEEIVNEDIHRGL